MSRLSSGIAAVYQEGRGKMSISVGIIDEPVKPGAADNLDINIHSEALHWRFREY
jgi:hypothetical protein